MTTPTAPTEPAGPALSIQAPQGAHRADDAPTPAPAGSPLAALRTRRAKMAEALYIDIRVPGWGDDPAEDPRVHLFVRCRPIKPSELETLRTTRRNAAPRGGKGKGKVSDNGWLDLANADVLIKTCLEVWALEGDPRDPADVDESDRLSLDEDAGVHGEKTRFDVALATTLGLYDPDSDMERPRAVEIVRHVFLHDGAVMAAAAQVIDFSGLGNAAAEESEGFTAG